MPLLLCSAAAHALRNLPQMWSTITKPMNMRLRIRTDVGVLGIDPVTVSPGSLQARARARAAASHAQSRRVLSVEAEHAGLGAPGLGGPLNLASLVLPGRSRTRGRERGGTQDRRSRGRESRGESDAMQKMGEMHPPQAVQSRQRAWAARRGAGRATTGPPLSAAPVAPSETRTRAGVSDFSYRTPLSTHVCAGGRGPLAAMRCDSAQHAVCERAHH
jgi:hypothetical protein